MNTIVCSLPIKTAGGLSQIVEAEEHVSRFLTSTTTFVRKVNKLSPKEQRHLAWNILFLVEALAPLRDAKLRVDVEINHKGAGK